jgi:putative membrane protein
MRKKLLNKKTVICFCVILGIVIIPLMYSYFYLGAFWDPYSRLQDLPVAVVNLDKGAVVNGQTRNLGQEMCDELKANGSLKFVFTDKEDAENGTKGTEYYAVLTIPEDFTSDVASVSSADKQTAQLTLKSNEKRNYLAAQILNSAVKEVELSLRGKLNAEIVNTLCNKLKSTPDQLTELVNGLSQLSDGAGKIEDGTGKFADGTATLKDGQNTFTDKLGQFNSGVANAQSGANQLYSGINALNDGIEKLANGAKQLDSATENIDELRKNSALLAEKAKEYNQGMSAYATGVESLIASVESTAQFLRTYVKANPQLMQNQAFAQFITSLGSTENTGNIAALKQYTTQMMEGSAAISDAISLLSNATAGIPELKAGITQLKESLIKTQDGSQQIVQGSKTLKDGLATLNSAAKQLSDASKQLAEGAEAVNSGAEELKNGTAALKDGINTAKTQIDEKMAETDEQLKLLDGLGTYAEAPVTITNEATDPVPNYGTAFSPYFLSLSMWVGGLVIFVGIYFDTDRKFKLLSRNSDKVVLRSFAYLLIALIQAVLLGFILRYGLGLEVNHPTLYYLSCCLISLVFVAIVQFLMVVFKDIGKFLSIALLILQLTACGGTFPMETVPKLFNILYPFMPMTYSVRLLKEAISGVDTSGAAANIWVLVGILVVFMGLTVLYAIIKKKKTTAVAAEA